jgi:hypothetical protein
MDWNLTGLYSCLSPLSYAHCATAKYKKKNVLAWDSLLADSRRIRLDTAAPLLHARAPAVTLLFHVPQQAHRPAPPQHLLLHQH